MDMAKAREKGREPEGKKLSLVLAQKAELFTRPGGVSWGPLAVPPCLIHRITDVRRRASPPKAACSRPPSFVFGQCLRSCRRLYTHTFLWDHSVSRDCARIPAMASRSIGNGYVASLDAFAMILSA